MLVSIGTRRKKSSRIKLMLVLFLYSTCGTLHAEIGLSAASGYGVAHSIPLRIGVQKSFGKNWRMDSDWPIGGYGEASLYHLSGEKGLKAKSHHHLTVSAVAAVVRLERKEKIKWGWPYLEIGFGLSLLNQKEFGARELGTHFQFEDRLGVGLRFGENREYDLSYKAIHFSNAYIGSYNHGINLHLISFGYWFN